MFAGIFPVVLLVYLYLPETATEPTGEGGRVIATVREYLTDITSELHNSAISVVYVGAISEYFVKYGILTFLPLFVVRGFGASGAVVGALLSVYGIVRLFASPLSGPAVAQFSRRFVIVGTVTLIAGSLAVLPLASGVLWVGVVMVLYSTGDSILSPVINDTTVTLASDEHRAGVVSGLNTCKNIGKTLAPALLGLVLTLSGFTAVFWAAGGLLLAYAGVILLMPRFDSESAS